MLLYIAGTDYPSVQQVVSLTPQSASVQEVEVPVIPDDVFEANETFVLFFNVRSSIRRRIGIEFSNEAQVTILNDDGELFMIKQCCVLIYCMLFVVVVVNLEGGSPDATEGSNYTAFVSAEPTNLMTSFDVIVETYMCGECLAATRKIVNSISVLMVLFFSADLDYIPVSEVVTLGPENASEEITIAILEDIYDEEDNEVVCFRLILPEDNQAFGVQLGAFDMNFTITDDSCKEVYFVLLLIICLLYSQCLQLNCFH